MKPLSTTKRRSIFDVGNPSRPPQILCDHAELVERCCAVIVRLVDESLNTVRHSTSFWFLLFRRLAPTILRTVLSRRSCSNDSREEVSYTPTVVETLSLLTGLILDSDTSVVAAEFIRKHDVSGIDFSSIGVSELVTVGTVVGYAIQIQQYRVAFRFINKGVPLDALGNSTAPSSNTDQSAVRDYERRRQSYMTVTGFSGVWFDPASLSTRSGAETEWAMLRMFFPAGLRIQVEGTDQVLNSLWLVADYLEERHLPNISSLLPTSPHVIPRDNGEAMCGLPLRAILSAIPEEFFIDYSRAELSDFMFAVYLVIRTCLDIPAVVHSVESPDGMQVIPRSALASIKDFRAYWSDVAALAFKEAIL